MTSTRSRPDGFVRFLLNLGFACGLAAWAAGCATIKPAPEAVTVHPVQDKPGAPKVLCVVAHPDDETVFAGALFKIATHLGGAADILVITNGEGGFKYSTLAERLYGKELTEEPVGRKHLPAIRKREFLAGCRHMGIRRAYFLNQTDHRYTRDPQEVLASDAGVWDLALIRRAIAGRLEKGAYDFVFVHSPTLTTHGHHQAATLLALEAVDAMPAEQRPVIACARTLEKGTNPPQPFLGNPKYPLTSINKSLTFDFDRSQGFGYKGRLSYKIVVNWVIAEHKSQGTMQLAANRGDIERYWLFNLNGPGAQERAKGLFSRLAEPQFPSKTYGPSAGVPK